MSQIHPERVLEKRNFETGFSSITMWFPFFSRAIRNHHSFLINNLRDIIPFYRQKCTKYLCQKMKKYIFQDGFMV